MSPEGIINDDKGLKKFSRLEKAQKWSDQMTYFVFGIPPFFLFSSYELRHLFRNTVVLSKTTPYVDTYRKAKLSDRKDFA